MKTPGFFTREWNTKGVPTISWEGVKALPVMNIKMAGMVFLAAARILNQLGVKFWLNTGTALGAVRDKGIIPSDIDVDVVIFAEDCNLPVIIKAFKSKGFQCATKLYPTLYRDKPSGIVVTAKGIRVDIDLNYLYPPEDLIFKLDVKPHNHGTVRPAKFYRGEHFISFLGIEVRIPYPPEEYFELCYGERHPRPCSDWSWLDAYEPISIDKYVEYIHECAEVK